MRSAAQLCALLAVGALIGSVVPGEQRWPVDAAGPTAVRAPFGSAQLEGSRLRAEPGRSAGVQYTISGLDAEEEYELWVKAGASSVGLTATLMVGDRNPEWVTTPDRPGPFRIIGGGETARVIFYTEHGGTYRTPGLLVRPCTSRTCATDAALRASILRQDQAIRRAIETGDTEAAARAILRWAAPRIPWAGSAEALIPNTGPFSAATLYYGYFRNGRGGVFCGGAADFLVKLLRLFDVKAFPIDFGEVAGSLTHVTVVVPLVEPDGSTVYRVFDPTFGIELEQNGAPAEILDAFDGTVDARRVIALDRRRVLTTPADGRAGRFDAVRCSRDAASGGCGLDAWTTLSSDALAAAGYEPGFPGLMGLLTGPGAFSWTLREAPADFRRRYRELAPL